MSGRFGGFRRTPGRLQGSAVTAQHGAVTSVHQRQVLAMLNLCLICGLTGHDFTFCPNRSVKIPRNIKKHKSPSAKRYDLRRCVQYQMRKQMPFADLDDEAFKTELKCLNTHPPVPQQTAESWIGKLFSRLDGLEKTFTQQMPTQTMKSVHQPVQTLCAEVQTESSVQINAVSTQTLSSSFQMADTYSQTNSSTNSESSTQTDSQSLIDFSVQVNISSQLEVTQQNLIAGFKEDISKFKNEVDGLKSKVTVLERELQVSATSSKIIQEEKRSMQKQYHSVSQSLQHFKTKCVELQNEIAIKNAECKVIGEKTFRPQNQCAQLETSVQHHHSDFKGKSKSEPLPTIMNLHRCYVSPATMHPGAKEPLRQISQSVRYQCDSYGISEHAMFEKWTNNTMPYHDQSLRDFALEIKRACKGAPVTAEEMYGALFNKRYDVYMFLRSKMALQP